MTYQERIKKIVDSIDDVVEISKALSVNAIYGETQNRIFNEGKDKKNLQIGTYTEAYKAVRRKKGLQTSFVDQTFSTNLKSSISRSKDAIFFKNEYGRKVSGYNEKRFGKRIYAPSAEERMIFINILDKELTKLWI